MTPPIEQCPYCFGKHPELTTNTFGFQVICQDCLATGPSKTAMKEAKSSWNLLTQELQRSRQWYAAHFTRELDAIDNIFLANVQKLG
jgi:Tfp pilus assembly PilM family ATPase